MKEILQDLLEKSQQHDDCDVGEKACVVGLVFFLCSPIVQR